jgi:hypothetical protein
MDFSVRKCARCHAGEKSGQVHLSVIRSRIVNENLALWMDRVCPTWRLWAPPLSALGKMRLFRILLHGRT